MAASIFEGKPPAKITRLKSLVDGRDALALVEDFVREASEGLPRDLLEALSDELHPRPIIRRPRMASSEGIRHAANRRIGVEL